MGWLDFFTRKNIPKAPFVLKYESLDQHHIPAMRTVDRLQFIVLDTETTGLNPKEDYILSFGAVKLKGYTIQIQTAQEMYLKAQALKNDAIKVHGIIPKGDFTSLPNFAEKVLSYIGTDIIVGHHIGFDLAMIEKAMKPFGLRNIQNPIIDTLDLAIRLEKGPNFDTQLARGEYSLDQLCTRYGIEVDDRHTAAGDAFLTAQLFLKLLKIAEKKGIKTYGDLMR